MSEWRQLTDDSQVRWDENAAFWDAYMGELSNRFHREIVRPDTERLLNVREGGRYLDAACGNGNFSRRLAELGAEVVAFDYSPNMIELARSRSAAYEDRIDYRVVNAADRAALLELGRGQYDGAVANMALMDIADPAPLAGALAQLLKPGGAFVFSIPHPCFQAPDTRKILESGDDNGTLWSRSSVQVSSYLTPASTLSIGIQGQPVPHRLFHRPLSYYMQLFLAAGFVLDGWAEPSYPPAPAAGGKFEWRELPPAVIFRFRLL